MKVLFLDQARNELQLSGEIEKDFTIAQGKLITFGEGSTFQGKLITSGTKLYNESSMSMTIGLSISGSLVLMPTSPIILEVGEYELEGLLEESEYEEEFREKDDFYVNLEEMLYQYLVTKQATSNLEYDNVELERALEEMQKAFPEIKLPKIRTEIEIEEVSKSEFIEEDDTKFESSMGAAYGFYDNLDSRRILLEMRKEELENLLDQAEAEAALIIEKEELEIGYESDDEEGSEMEEDDVALEGLQERYQALQKELAILIKENRDVGDIIEQIKQDSPKKERAELLKSFEEQYESLQKIVKDLEEKVSALGTMIEIAILSAEEEIEDSYETDGEETETEDELESPSIKSVSFSTQLTEEISHSEELIFIPPLLVRSSRSSIDEWREIVSTRDVTSDSSLIGDEEMPIGDTEA